jgi:hypothetical protein
MEPTGEPKKFELKMGPLAKLQDVCGQETDAEADPHFFKPLKVCLMFTIWLSIVMIVGVLMTVTFSVASGRFEKMVKKPAEPVEELNFLEEIFEFRLRSYNPRTGSLSAFYLFSLVCLAIFGIDMYVVRREEYKQLVILTIVHLPLFAICYLFEKKIGIDCRLAGSICILLAYYVIAVRRKEKRQEVEMDDIEQVQTQESI